VKLHLVDATYELFRAYFGAPPKRAPDGVQVGAVRGVLYSMMTMLRSGEATHVACATDAVIRSFRNDLYDGYKTEDGVPADLLAQFPLVEEALRALGVVVWPMIEFEADDALASAAVAAAVDDVVEQVLVCTPDKDLGQVVGGKIVQLDRRKREIRDAEGVRAK
jgi:5'-3' exonuclease